MIATFVGVLSLTIFGIAQLLAFLNTGADRSTIFHKDLAKTNYYTPQVTWTNTENPGRPLEVATQSRIERDYMDALYLQSIALQSLNTDGIKDVYTKKACQNLIDVIATNTKNNTRIEKTTFQHNIALDFYSADGQLVVLTDKNVTSYSRVSKNEKFLFDISEVSDYKIMMLLEDGYWKIRHIEKLSSEQKPQNTTQPIVLSTPVSGLNYYPQDSAWDTFGMLFSEEKIDRDFAIIRDLGLNTVRVFIGYEDFGKANVSKEKLEKLTKLLDMAKVNEIKVLVTLFDFYGDYSVIDWTQTQQHAIRLARAIKDHDALLGWDIKNEPNLDYSSRGESLVKAWLTQMTDVIRQEDPSHPITIGWSNAETALDLADQVDFISFHYYEGIKDLPITLATLREQTDKVIVLEEFGMSTYSGLWNPFGYSEEDQKEYYQAFYKNQKRDSINYLSWTLYDFSEIPNQVAGRYPWKKNKQTSFGLIDISGTKKSSFEVVKNN